MFTPRHVLFILVATSAPALAGSSPVPAATLAHVFSFTPSPTEVTDDHLTEGLQVTFDRDMVLPAAVGKAVAGPTLDITPAVPGEARWVSPRTLAFFPKNRLQASTTYQVRLSSGFAQSIEPWPGHRFVYDRIQVTELRFDGSAEFSSTQPLVRLRLSQAAGTKQVLASCAFCEPMTNGSGPCTRAKLAPTKARVTDAESLLDLTPETPLRAQSRYLFRCTAPLQPAKGDAGSLKDFQEEFATHGPAGVKMVEPVGNQVPADDVRMTIEFKTPVKPELVRSHVELVDGKGKAKTIDLAANWRSTTYTWSGALMVGTPYEVRIKPGLTDIFGQALPSGTIHHFQVGDASPRLRMESGGGIFVVEKSLGRYPIWARNLESLHIRCAEVPESQLAAVLGEGSSFDKWLTSNLVREKTLPVGPRNQWQDASLKLADVCGNRSKSGLYVLETDSLGESDYRGRSGKQTRRALASLTDLGLVAKVGNASSLVWVVSLSTSQPVAHATVKIRDAKGKIRFEGTTNADGILQGPGASQMIKVKPRPASRNDMEGDGEGDGDGEGFQEEYQSRRVIVTAQTNDDFAVLHTGWSNGIAVWNFGIRPDFGGGKVRVRGFLHSDRGLYRPGDTVHLKGLVRLMDASGRMSVPPNQRRVHLVVKDPRAKVLVDQKLPISEFGGFFKDVVVSADAKLGDYQVRGEIEGQSFTDHFSVEEYRPRNFEVKITAAKSNILLGQRLRFEVKASFLYGGPMAGGKLTYAVRRRPHLPRFSGFEDYVFQDYAELYAAGRYWARDEERSFSEPIEDSTVELDRTGKARVVVQDKEEKLSGPQDYIFQGTVTDSTGQAVTAGEVVVAHQSKLYLGLHPAEFVQTTDKPFAIQMVGFDIAGNRCDAQAELELYRRSYDCGYHGTSSQWSCTTKVSRQPDFKRTVQISASGSVATEQVLVKDPGEYIIRLSTKGKGAKAIASDVIWVMGKGQAYWNDNQDDRMTVVASKSKYAPGDTAQLVAQTQLPGALALVTLERDGILSYSLTSLATSGQALQVKMTPELAPNVFASVVMVRGRLGQGDGNRPRFKMGVVDLKVEASQQRLRVNVETERPSYQPGEEVKARVLITSATGEPVRSEVALAVADEGVLQIVGFKTPDPMSAFYAPFGLGVDSATTWNRILRKLDPNIEDEEEGGDGGGEEAGRIRSRFMATAFWAPALVSGPDGRVEVTFKAPDNLTAFRVMAVAADPGIRFGSGDRRFTVAKPLQAIPALPRFLTPGDQAQAAVAVHNNTDDKLEVGLTATITGLTVRGAASRKLSVPAHGSRRVVFHVSAKHTGEASFLFKAEAQDLSDQVLMRIPVRRPTIPETLMVGEGSTRGSVTHVLPPLGEVVAGQGGLELTLDRSGMGRLDEGLAYLVGYPYGCLEQTTSKVVPMIALAELVRNAHLPGVDAGQARHFIEIGIAKILRHQDENGGFGLWIGAPPEPHYSATGLWGLAVAKAAGFAVDKQAIAKGAEYLRSHMSSGHSLGSYATDAFSQYVLASLKHPDAGALARMYENRASLPIYGRAFLLRALVESGRTDLVKTLANELLALVPPASSPALIREVDSDLRWYWSSDLRTTAMVLWALAKASPGDPRLSQLTETLLKSRIEGHWGNTQENLYGLLALADLAKMRASSGKVKVEVRLGDKTLARKTVSAAAVEHVSVPLGKLGKGPLVISTDSGEIYYSARIRVQRLMGDQALDQGIAIERAYLDPESKQPVQTIRLGQPVLISLSVTSPTGRAHVALVDRLPAGFEPVLTRFSNQDQWQDTSAPRADWSSAKWNTIWQNLELRDDRMQIFADMLSSGTSTHEYLVRATSTGKFAAPPATAEAMYDPAVQGRTPAQMVEIVK